mmetsp:Transcript_31616/g.99390  ORF Transcript_31616/g.99390 Transcript_31616/m.99390 type:complete len:208 (+) Transcript_31616:367-990(+)
MAALRRADARREQSPAHRCGQCPQHLCRRTCAALVMWQGGIPPRPPRARRGSAANYDADPTRLAARRRARGERLGGSPLQLRPDRPRRPLELGPRRLLRPRRRGAPAAAAGDRRLCRPPREGGVGGREPRRRNHRRRRRLELGRGDGRAPRPRGLPKPEAPSEDRGARLAARRRRLGGRRALPRPHVRRRRLQLGVRRTGAARARRL